MSRLNFSNILGGAVFGSLNAFLQHNASRDGYAKANRYEIVILLPSGVSNSSDAGFTAQSQNVQSLLGGETARRISFRCSQITIPGRSLRTAVNGNIYGPNHQIVQGQTFANVEAQFYCGSDLAERYFFEEWQKTTYNPDTYDINYYMEYVGSIEIYQLNEQDERTYGCKLEEVFPITIGGLTYGHGNKNQIQTVTVEFAYRYWRNIATEPQKANLDSTLQDILKNSILRNIQSRIPQVIRRLFK